MTLAVICTLAMLAPTEDQIGSSERVPPGLEKLADCHGVARFDQGNVVEFLLLRLRDDRRLY